MGRGKRPGSPGVARRYQTLPKRHQPPSATQCAEAMKPADTGWASRDPVRRRQSGSSRRGNGGQGVHLRDGAPLANQVDFIN